MKSLEALIEALQEEPLVKEYRAIEARILSDEKLSNQYEDLLEAQKRYVRAKHRKQDFAKEEKAYETLREDLSKHPLIHQYLVLQEQLNEEIRMLYRMIEDALCLDFETR